LQRHGAQSEHQHPVVPQQSRRHAARLPPGAVLRARRPARGGSAIGRIRGEKIMSAAGRIALALVLLLAAREPAAAVERILLFISDATVERDGELAVTETIRVQAEGNQIRRGILRDFPTSYRGRDGARVEVGFQVQSVSRDGSPENWSTEGMS